MGLALRFCCSGYSSWRMAGRRGLFWERQISPGHRASKLMIAPVKQIELAARADVIPLLNLLVGP